MTLATLSPLPLQRVIFKYCCMTSNLVLFWFMMDSMTVSRRGSIISPTHSGSMGYKGGMQSLLGGGFKGHRWQRWRSHGAMFDDMDVPWNVANNTILKQHDGCNFNCGPIACLMVIEIYGILPVNVVAEIGHQNLATTALWWTTTRDFLWSIRATNNLFSARLVSTG